MAAGADNKRKKDANNQNFDCMFKLLIIGNSSVGKTSFLFRCTDNTFTSALDSTLGTDFKVKTVFRNDKRIKLQIWDTAGQEKFESLTSGFYRGAMGFILMYDITNEESFRAVSDWANEAKLCSWEHSQVVLVGNKCDMEEDRAIDYDQGKRLADHLGFPFFESSVKDNINIKSALDKLVDIVCDKLTESHKIGPSMIDGAEPRLTNPRYQNKNCHCYS